MKVAIVSTHPIQYHTPWFQKLAEQEQVDLKVYYALLPDQRQQGVGFDKAFAWDIPLLEGYEWELIHNKRKSPSLRGFFGSSTPAIHSLLAERKPDVVIITGWQSLPLLQAQWAAVRLGIPCIVRGESNALRPRPWWVRLWHRRLLSRFDAFLAIGKLNRQFYLNYGVADERIFSCPYFIDNERFAVGSKRAGSQRALLRAQWNIPEGGTCFLFAGKLMAAKRIMDLLRGVDRALLSCPAIQLLVVGTGEKIDEARRFAEIRNLPVRFAGFLNQTEIARAYAAADCLVLPSESETWGLVVNEAMSCGLPAIVSDRVGCWPDLVEDGLTGAVFRCGDIEALASKLVEFASDRENLLRMGQQARRRIEDYSVEQAVAGTLRAIEFVMEDGRPATNNGRRTADDGRRSVVGRSSTVVPPPPVSRLIRVLHVIPSLSTKDGGPSFAMPLIAGGLARAGVRVDVATTDSEHESKELGAKGQERDGATCFYFRRQLELYKVSFPLSRWLSQHIREYDLVHIHALFSYSSYTAATLAAKNGVPYIIRPLGVLNRWGMHNRRPLLKLLSFRFIERRILNGAAAVQYTSRQEKLEAEQAGVGNNAAVVPLGIDLSPFRESSCPERFYQRFPRAQGRDVILFLSRLDPKKGLDLLLRAFARLHKGKDRRRTREDRRQQEDRQLPLLVIAGDGDDKFVAGLRSLAEQLGLFDEILWAGFLAGDDKSSAMASASVFVLPSYSENFGIAVVEAMAAGLACVISDQVGIAAEVSEYEAGLVVPCEVAPLASAMQRLIDDSELRGRLGNNAKRLVADRFSLDVMASALVALYGQVLRAKSQGQSAKS